MRRPLFLFFIGLVLGEAAAIFLNRIGFFVMALFLLIFMIFCFIFYRKVRREQSLFFIYEVLCWFFFLMGGIAFFRASYFNEIDRILSKKTLTGTLIGQVEYVRQNAEGEYQITVRENSFVVNENHLKDGIKKNLKKCSISSIKSNLRQTKKLPGKCRLVKIPVSKGKIYPGDFITCTGKLKAIEEQTNPGEFNTKIYYYSVGIRYQFFGENLTRKRESPLSLHRIAGSVRERIDAIYRHILSDTEYALLKAIFLGDKTDLSKEQKHLYEENGMAHLLAVSGLHVSIVGGMLFRFLRKKGRSYAFSCMVGSGILFFYAIMTGFGNSVFRAAVNTNVAGTPLETFRKRMCDFFCIHIFYRDDFTHCKRTLGKAQPKQTYSRGTSYRESRKENNPTGLFGKYRHFYEYNSFVTTLFLSVESL